MKQQYRFHIKNQNPNWSKIHIENLLEYSRRNQDSSFVIYAALEARSLLERIEFELIIGSVNTKFGKQDFEDIKKRYGIKKANKKFNTLKFRYQTFTESFAKAINPDLSLKTYNYNESERLKEDLSQYLHLYSRTNDELEFVSDFIQNGFHHIKKSMDFIENYITKDANGIYYGCFRFYDFS